MAEVTAKQTIKVDGVVKFDSEGKGLFNMETVEYNFGETLDESVSLFGADAVHSNFVAQGKVAIQSFMRRQMAVGIVGESLQTTVSNYVLGQVAERIRIDPIAAAKARFATMTKEEQIEFIQSLNEAAAD